ncbi:MAG TPA: hypothetical protein VFE65_30185 [Pseudonocardia sp.]|jgi:hypothetical protein|nr:hypothetical protein [Pseudonocardia sp.]
MAETFDDKAQEVSGKAASVSDVDSGHAQREKAAEVARAERERGAAGKKPRPLLWIGVGLVALIGVLIVIVMLTSGLSSMGGNDRGASPGAPATVGH